MNTTKLGAIALLAGLCVPVAASAGSVTIGTITISQVAGNPVPGTFDNNAVGSFSGTSTAVYDNALGPISFTAGADTSGVSTGTTPINAAPAGDTSNYLWALHDGTTVDFATPATSFLIYWGSIDALAQANRYDNILTLSNGDALTGSDLVNAGTVLGSIDGLGTQSGPIDNQWFYVSDTRPFGAFTATSGNYSFEFDMATSPVPEPSTWAMMLVGFVGLAWAATRKARVARIAFA